MPHRFSIMRSTRSQKSLSDLENCDASTSTRTQVSDSTASLDSQNSATRRMTTVPSRRGLFDPLLFGDEEEPMVDLKKHRYLVHILSDEELANEFEKFAQNEQAIESLYFVRDAYFWKRNYFALATNAQVARARKIMATYVESDGSFAVNIPWEISEEIHEALKQDRVPLTLFDSARMEVATLLERGCALNFAMSKDITL